MVALVEAEVFTPAAVLVRFSVIGSVFSYRTLYSSAIGVDWSSCQNSYTIMFGQSIIGALQFLRGSMLLLPHFEENNTSLFTSL